MCFLGPKVMFMYFGPKVLFTYFGAPRVLCMYFDTLGLSAVESLQSLGGALPFWSVPWRPTSTFDGITLGMLRSMQRALRYAPLWPELFRLRRLLSLLHSQAPM